jgi:hypothetical protein
MHVNDSGHMLHLVFQKGSAHTLESVGGHITLSYQALSVTWLMHAAKSLACMPSSQDLLTAVMICVVSPHCRVRSAASAVEHLLKPTQYKTISGLKQEENLGNTW